jgi:hypothetical protein
VHFTEETRTFTFWNLWGEDFATSPPEIPRTTVPNYTCLHHYLLLVCVCAGVRVRVHVCMCVYSVMCVCVMCVHVCDGCIYVCVSMYVCGVCV